MGEKWQNLPFLGKTRTLVPVPKVGTGTHWIETKWYRYRSMWYWYPFTSKGLVPLPIKVVPVSVSMLPTTLFYVPLALLSLIFVHRLFRDPNKGLMGVQIRIKLSEKHTIPRRLGEANSLGKLSVLTQNG